MLAFELGHQSAFPGSAVACQPSYLNWDMGSVEFGLAGLLKSVSQYFMLNLFMYHNNYKYYKIIK